MNLSFLKTTTNNNNGSVQFKRPSFIILSIGSVVALSAALMGFNGIHDILYPNAAGAEDGGICSAGV